jgi:hypothetical protein
MKVRTLVALFVGTVPGTLGTARAGTVMSTSPEWTLLPNSIGPNTRTWALAANLTAIGWGVENEPTCEPTGTFLVSNPFAIAGSGYYTIADASGALSDIVTVANVGGSGQIQFFSDPNPGSGTPPAGFTNLGQLCNEGASGCFGTFHLTTTSGAMLTIDAGSDAEVVFGPFGFGFDSSDQIRFTGVTPVNPTPEPSSIALLLGGVAALGYRSAAAIVIEDAAQAILAVPTACSSKIPNRLIPSNAATL